MNFSNTTPNVTGVSPDMTLVQTLYWTMVVVSAGAVISNILVLALFVVHRPLRTCTNALVASLAVADLTLGGVLLITKIGPEVKEWAPGCIFVYTVVPWSSVASPWSLLAITIDRYIFVRLPLVYCRKVGPRTVGATIAAVWTLSLSFALSGLLPWPETPGTRFLCDGAITRSLSFVCVHLGLVVVPCAGVALLYCLILQVARRSNRLHQELILLVPAANHNHDQKTLPQARDHSRTNHARAVDDETEERHDEAETKPAPSSPRKCRRIAKTTKMFFYLTVIFFVLWLPMNVSMVVLLFCKTCQKSEILINTVRVSMVLYMFTPMINPWLYTLRNRDFRAALRVLTRCHRGREGVMATGSSLMSRNSVDNGLR